MAKKKGGSKKPAPAYQKKLDAQQPTKGKQGGGKSSGGKKK